MIELFQSPFYHTVLNYSNRENLISEITSRYNKHPTYKPDSWEENVHTSIVYKNYSNNIDYFRQSNIPLDLVVEIDKIVQEFVKIKHLSDIGTFYIVEMWYNAYKNRQYQHMHKHANGNNMMYSGIYYMKFNEKEHSATRFYNPYFDINFENENVRSNSLLVNMPKIKENDIFIFPSAVGHDVLPQDSDDLRITIAFNIACIYNEKYTYS